MSDSQTLISQVQQGDPRALSALYDQYSGALYGVIFRMCKNEVEAQDLLQETFVKIWNNAKKYNPEKGKFYTWAYRIARNTVLNELRNPSRLIHTEDLSVYGSSTEVDDAGIDTFRLNGSLKKLEEHHQRAVELVYFEGLTHREAHKKMNVPLGTFKSYIQQALRKLRESYATIVVLGWILMKCMQ